MEKREKKVYSIEIIGVGLAFLYAVSSLVFLQYLNIPGFEQYTLLYAVLFGVLFVVSLAVVALKDWGRRLLITFNIIIILCISARYIPKIDLVPLGYLLLSIIVLLYFMQTKVRIQFHAGTYGAWRKSVLIVDDDAAIIKTMRPLFLSRGYGVLTATSGEEGLQIARTQNPDLILLDVILPGIKGREVCEELKSDPQTKDIPVVFLTAKDSPEDVEAEKEIGAAGHITKPVNMKVLFDTVNDIFDAKKKAR